MATQGALKGAPAASGGSAIGDPAAGLLGDSLLKRSGGSNGGLTASPPPNFHYVPGSIEQVCRMKELQERVAELDQALQREQDRSKLLQSDLARMRQQQSWSLAGSGSSGGSSPRHRGVPAPARMGPPDSASHMPADASSPFAAIQGVPAPAQAPHGDSGMHVHACAPAAAAACTAGGTAAAGVAAAPASAHMPRVLSLTSIPSCAAPTAGATSADTVVVSRSALELLYLKERAMDSAKEGIVIADCSLPDMPLIYANEGFSRMTGYDSSAVLGRNCRFLQNPPPGCTNPDSEANQAAVKELRAAINAGLPCVVQLMNYKRSGDPFVNYLSLNPVYDETGKLTHYVGVQSDITELVNHRKAELAAKHAALQAAAATEAKSQFLARMSHEIRTPLNGMIAVGQLLADTPLSPAQWDLVNTIRCSGETLLTLITDILDFSRIEANKMVLSNADFRLQTVIEAAMEIAGLQAAQKRLQVAYNIADTVPPIVAGDAQRLQQILLNILNNAVKFTEVGEILLEVWAHGEDEGSEDEQAAAGQQAQQQAQQAQQAPGVGDAQLLLQQGLQQLQLDTDAVAAPATQQQEVACGCAAPRSMLLQFGVKDTGIGISAENIGRLFQSFSQVDASPTRRHGGSGLGLAICQRLCQAMGGRMWAESGGPNDGSLFRWSIRVLLPQASRSRSGSGSAQRTPCTSGRCSMELNASARNSLDLKLFGLGSGSALLRAASSALTSLAGRRMLLVEPCPMVRHVLALALRRWGCSVCTVGSEAEGIARLKMAGAPRGAAGSAAGVEASPGSPVQATQPDGQQVLVPTVTAGAAAAAAARQKHNKQQHAAEKRWGQAKRRHMQVEHAEPVADSEFQAEGPYDVVIMDLQLQNLLSALMMYAHASEAQRVVFMGWPGDSQPEERPGSIAFGEGERSLSGFGGGSEAGALGGLPLSMHSSSLGGLPPSMHSSSLGALPLPSPFGSGSGGLAAQPPRMLTERLAAQVQSPGQRQLGYVVVTRPMRQGRLRLALDEVLTMQLDASTAGGSGERSGRSSGDRGHRPHSAGGGASRVHSRHAAASDAAHAACGAPGETLNQSAVVPGSPGSDSECGEVSSLGSRASSCSNLRCAGSTLVRATPTASHLDTAAAAGSIAPLRLLLAEDNLINMKVALGILRRMGCTNVVTAEDGEAALEALHAAGGPDAFDVILMDLHMPKKGGMEAVRDIRRTWTRYKTKIIAVTADAFEDTRDNCIANGFDGWLAKPFRVEEFARVMAVCRSGGALTRKRP